MFLSCAKPPNVGFDSFRKLKSMKGIEQKRADPKSSALKALNLMLGRNLLFRLGGRLQNAAFGYWEKHPIILSRHRISDLFTDHAHRATLHDDMQFTLHNLRQKY
ncbi:hypothetical protein HN011_001431 [Eciton burchellii]|nr:hypothetical protein HN011_001431 [Eciton burchellii]